jgi:DNA repair photolyase
MDTIKRKSLLYKSNVEYGDFTINPVLGCSHGCKYPCYAFMMAKRFGKVKNYEEWIKPKLVENCIDLLDKEIPINPSTTLQYGIKETGQIKISVFNTRG